MHVHNHPALEIGLGLDDRHVIIDRSTYEEILRRNLSPPAVTLSKRNLLALLHKLEMPGSSRTLIKPTPNGDVAVSVVSDKEAYRNREPGPMHPETEEFIRDVETALATARRIRAARCCTRGCGGCCGR